MKLIQRSFLSIALFSGMLILVVSACQKDGDNNDASVSKKLILLKVDYLTYDFEGGQQIELAPYSNQSDTLPLTVNYVQPSDFGNLSIYYQSTNTSGLVFDGSVIWAGTGARAFPTTLVADSAFTTGTPLGDIADSEFQLVHYDVSGQPVYYDSIWNGIKNLEIVNYCRSNNSTKMGLFLYQPSVGVGNPAEWDWYIVMEK